MILPMIQGQLERSSADTIGILVMIIYSVISFFVGVAVSGWASTLCSIWALGGLQLLAIGIIGEYIGKIYLETKRRPRFIVDEYLDDESYSE